MNAWTLVVGDEPLLDLARAWAGTGLLGRSYWARVEDCDGAHLSAHGLRCQRLPGGESVVLDLVEALAEDDPDAGLRVIWTRRHAAGTEAETDLAGMEALDALLLQRANWVERIDLVAPQSDHLTAYPTAHPRWETIVVGEEDASTPGGTTRVPADATPQLLHAACVLGGVLGGVAGRVEPRSASGAQHTRAATAFSRIVTGRASLTDAMARFVREGLPGASALDVHPSDHTDEGAQVLLRDSHDLLRRPVPQGITFLHPATQTFSDREDMGLATFLARLAGFVDYLFHRSTPLSGRDLVDNQIADLLEQEDLGFQVVRHEPGVVDILNYADEDAALVQYLHRLWGEERDRAQDGRPDPELWQELVDLATALVDGGPLPPGLPTITRGERRIAVPLERVQGGGVLGTDPEAAIAGVPHRPLADATAAATRSRVDALVQSAAPALQGTGTVTSAVTDRIAATIARVDDLLRREQRERLGPLEDGDEISWLESLRADVTSDLIAAHLDAERSFRLATADIGEITALPGARFWFWVTGGVGGALAVQAANLVWGPDAGEWLAGATGLPVTSLWLTVAAAVVSVLLVVLPFLGYYRTYLAYRERGARQLEARALLFRRALLAHREHRRLRSADLLLSHWSTVLRAVYPPASALPPEERTESPARSPLSLRTAELIQHPGDLRRWIIEAGARAGWRGVALRGLVSIGEPRADAVDQLTRLCEDDGGPGRPLATLVDDLERRWGAWERAQRTRVTATLHQRALAEGGEVRHPDGHPEPLSTFLADVEDAMVPGASYGRPVISEERRPQEVRLDHETADLNADVHVASSQLYHRLLEDDGSPADACAAPMAAPGPVA